jgi:hypothetical protein
MAADAPRPISSRRIWLARALAVLADLIQIGFFFALSEGFASPFDAALDVVVAIVLTLLIGWHIAFIPSFIIKALPFADMAPTWTIAVLIATRSRPVTTRAGPL